MTTSCWMMTRCLAISICAAGLALAQTAPAPAPAQGTPGPRGRGQNPEFGRGRGPGRGLNLFGPNAETRLTKQFALNATQQNSLHTALQSAKVQEQGMGEKRAALQQQLRTAVKAGDEGTIDSVSREVAALHQQQTSIRAKALATVYGTLSADQKTKFEPMMNRELGLGGPGPGGPGGPGGNGPAGRGPRPRTGAQQPALQ